jgi:hypothetical protein
VKRHCTAALFALCAAASLAAQTDTSALTDVLLNVNTYSPLFLSRTTGLINGKYVRVANDDDCKKIGSLGGNETFIDTPLEIALLSTCAGVVDVRPVEANNILGNARQADLKLGAAVYQEMQILRFLGNTDAVGRHEGIIKFITDRGNVTRAELVDYLKQGIAQTVDAEFGKVRFMIDRKYNTTLTRNSQTGQYTLSYERPSIENDDKKITATSLDDLRAKMTASRDFTADGITLVVNEKAGYIPATVYADWQTRGTANGVALVKETITNFYLNPTQDNYKTLLGIFSRYASLTSSVQDPFAEAADWSLSRTISTLNDSVYSKIVDDLAHSDIRALARIPNDPRYDVFSIPYR